MARPPRAETASTRHVGFRLTDEEIERLDQLVLEHGCSDRSALLRAWLERGGPTPRTNSKTTTRASVRTTSEATASSDESVSLVEIHPPTNSTRKLPPNVKLVPRTSTTDTSASRPVEKPSIMRELLTELNRRRGELLIRVADVVRALLPHASIETVHEALLTLNRNGLIELRPDGGSEFLSEDDAALCPRGPRQTVFSYARWTDTSTR